MSKSIMPYNDKRQPNGLWELYRLNHEPYFKCYYDNGKEVGYKERHTTLYKDTLTLTFNI